MYWCPRVSTAGRALAVLVAAAAFSGCQTEGVRIPGAGSFPPLSGISPASKTIEDTVFVELPVDERSKYWDKQIANTQWNGCRDDTLADGVAVQFIQDRLASALTQAKVFSNVSEIVPGAKWKVSTRIRAFCSETRGFIIRWIGGIVALDITLTRDGVVVSSRSYERIVTDQDPEYTGSQITFIQQAMRTTMADALRVALRDATKDIESAATQ